MRNVRGTFKRYTLISLLLLVTGIWTVAPIVHAYSDHSEHTQTTEHNKQECVICIGLSMPYMPGTTLRVEMVSALLLFVVSTLIVSKPYISVRYVRGLRAPPVCQS